ncbi:MAG: PQQ-dependent sugar dehydrogenase [Alphaproteobacteria bacterium]
MLVNYTSAAHRASIKTSVEFRVLLILVILITASWTGAAEIRETGPSENLVLPQPFATRSVANPPTIIEWPGGKKPLAPPGFKVDLFASGLDNPRSILVLPNADVLVMESLRQRSGSRVILFRDSAKTGVPDRRETFVSGLNMAYGMALVGDRFYVGNTDSVMVFPYHSGDSHITGRGSKILDLPAVGGHYTRNLIADPAGRKLYVAVGSQSNVDQQGHDTKDPRRAAILQINLDGSEMRVFASGMRNPVGMDWEPSTKLLWAVVNERDLMGDELVPDYLTAVREGAFYGWPYSYFGQNVDPRPKKPRPDLVAKAIKPDYALGSHVAPLGLAFYTGESFPQHYHGGAFIGMHGSWNRSKPVGYKVAFVPFKNGRPSGMVEDFLTGFIANQATNEVYGRPVGVAVWSDGSLLVADDASGRIWRVSVNR